MEPERQKHWLGFVFLRIFLVFPRTEAELKSSGSAAEVEHSLVR